MAKYEVIDNYLPIDVFETMVNAIDNDDQNFPWFYNRFVDDDAEGEMNDHFYFVHLFLLDSVVTSHFYSSILPLIHKIMPKALIRIKANAYPKNGNKIIKHRPHIDHDFEHKGAIFYLNTNTGKTILEDGTEIDSVANRMLLFDSSKSHTSTNCTDAKMRFNININYF